MIPQVMAVSVITPVNLRGFASCARNASHGRGSAMEYSDETAHEQITSAALGESNLKHNKNIQDFPAAACKFFVRTPNFCTYYAQTHLTDVFHSSFNTTLYIHM